MNFTNSYLLRKQLGCKYYKTKKIQLRKHSSATTWKFVRSNWLHKNSAFRKLSVWMHNYSTFVSKQCSPGCGNACGDIYAIFVFSIFRLSRFQSCFWQPWEHKNGATGDLIRGGACTSHLFYNFLMQQANVSKLLYFGHGNGLSKLHDADFGRKNSAYKIVV